MSNNLKAACVLIFSQDGSKILAVSRKDDFTAFGIPGGKLDPNEDFLQAAFRETLEETGYTIKISETSKLNPYEVVDENGVLVQTYVARIDGSMPRQQLDVSETGVVKYVKPDVLFAGPFSQYNKDLLAWFNGLSTEIKASI